MKLEEAIKSSRFANEKHKASLNVLYSAYWLRNNFSMAVKPFDLTLEQHNVLRILMGQYPEQICVKDIGVRTIEKSSNVPRIIDKLEEKGFAVRTTSREDKRETLVGITPKGIDIIRQARAALDSKTAQIMNLDEQESLLLNNLLEKMRIDNKRG